MAEKVALLLTVNQRLQEITRGYRAFLQQHSLQDAPLARMTYFYTVKKVYVEDPLSNEEEQAKILERLDTWMVDIQHHMDKLMQQG